MRNTITASFCTLVAALSVSAQVPTLTLTEESSTLLTYSWDGGPSGSITTLTPNLWAPSILISEPAALVGAFGDSVTFSTPDEGGTFNSIAVNRVDGSGLSPEGIYINVASEQPSIRQGFPLSENGTPVTAQFGLFAVIFLDNGDAVSTPDAGSSILLLSVALGSLGIIARRTSRR